MKFDDQSSRSDTQSETARPVLTVSQLNRQARFTIEERFNQVWVTGEISNFARPRSGHWYLTLKDDNAQVRCAMFVNRNRYVNLQPANGQLVIVRGRVSLYEGRGEFQIILEHMEAAGEGALRQAFDQLKVKLAREGLFDAATKQPLPDYPQHCAVITSQTGAALRDVLSVWQRRYPGMRVTLLPVAVQGEHAEAEICSAIKRADELAPDVILLTRGGGSLEDLWAFNLESVARAINHCKHPIVSAIGHEIDTTISDLVADLRAPTPSAAAEIIAPNRAEMMEILLSFRQRLASNWARLAERAYLRLQNRAQRLINPEQFIVQAAQRVDDRFERLLRGLEINHSREHNKLASAHQRLMLAGPEQRLRQAQQQTGYLANTMHRLATQLVEKKSRKLAETARLLSSLSPLPTLARGFSISVDAEHNVVTDAAAVKVGDRLITYLDNGAVGGVIDQIEQQASITQPLPKK